jgi:hypothetical protein
VHALTQVLRTLTRIVCPAVVFKAEAIVGPQELLAYLGVREYHGKVSDLAYHNSLMVHVWSMLASQDVRLAARALKKLDEKPSTTAWITYARSHDDIGWAISDEDAAASSPTSTPASSPAPGRVGWCSRRTATPGTGGCPGRWRRWPASRRATRTPCAGSCSCTH